MHVGCGPRKSLLKNFISWRARSKLLLLCSSSRVSLKKMDSFIGSYILHPFFYIGIKYIRKILAFKKLQNKYPGVYTILPFFSSQPRYNTVVKVLLMFPFNFQVGHGLFSQQERVHFHTTKIQTVYFCLLDVTPACDDPVFDRSMGRSQIALQIQIVYHYRWRWKCQT